MPKANFKRSVSTYRVVGRRCLLFNRLRESAERCRFQLPMSSPCCIREDRSGSNIAYIAR